MRALVRTTDALEVREDCPVRRPRAGEVLVKVMAFSLSQQELNGDFTGGDKGRIVGSGVAGKIVSVGEDVPAWRLGDIVIIDPGLGRREGGGLLGIDRDGGAADYLVASAVDACAVAAGLATNILPLLASHYSLAERVLTWGRLYSSEIVLIIGADYGAGPAAVELAVARHAHVYAVAGQWAHSSLAELGAKRIEKSLAELGQFKANVIADFRIECAWPDCFGLLGDDGTYVSAKGDIARTFAPPVSVLDEPDIFTMETLEHLARMTENGKLAPKPAKVVTFGSMKHNVTGIFSEQQLGPTVVTVSE
ncbi:alcohol dehydrogenase catalytic domain-containing protein [Mesorhizobium sp. M0091]|uniref:alcohol dehydrogenase catalytic domain-containing protein n=1 Tax=Mesorhizobium sp. M0091 TaxID=2956875 RepID=UPI0033370231